MAIQSRKPNGLMALIDLSLMVAFVALANSAFLVQDKSQHVSLDVQLPHAPGVGASREERRSVDIVLGKDGHLRINGQAVALVELSHNVFPNQAVRIVADREARAESLLRLENHLSEIGVKSATYLVEGGNE